MQQGNDPKAANLQQSGWEKRIKVLQWPSQSSNLNLIEMMYLDLKESVLEWMSLVQVTESVNQNLLSFTQDFMESCDYIIIYLRTFNQ